MVNNVLIVSILFITFNKLIMFFFTILKSYIVSPSELNRFFDKLILVLEESFFYTYIGFFTKYYYINNVNV